MPTPWHSANNLVCRVYFFAECFFVGTWQIGCLILHSANPLALGELRFSGSVLVLWVEELANYLIKPCMDEETSNGASISSSGWNGLPHYHKVWRRYTKNNLNNLNFGDRLTSHSLVKLGETRWKHRRHLHIASNLLTIDEYTDGSWLTHFFLEKLDTPSTYSGRNKAGPT